MFLILRQIGSEINRLLVLKNRYFCDISTTLDAQLCYHDYPNISKTIPII